MKTMILIVALCVACLLTGCKNMQKDDSPAVTDPTDGAGIVTEDTSDDHAHATIDATVGPEHTSDSESDEPTVSDEPTQQAGDIKQISVEHSHMAPVISDNKILLWNSDYDQEKDILHYYVNVYDMSGELLKTLPFDEYNSIAEMKAGYGDVLCQLVLDEYYNPEDDTSVWCVVDIMSDYTCINRGEYTYDKYYTVHGEHKVGWEEFSLVDAETGEMLVEGVRGTNGKHYFDRLNQHYICPIDENRFLYRTTGFESMPGFGIYDYSSGEATHFSDSIDQMQLGYYNGKIYSVATTWDGNGTEVYASDINTLETKFAYSVPFDASSINSSVYYKMSPDGSFIIMLLESYGEDRERNPIELYKVSTEDGNVLWQTVLPDDLVFSSGISFVDNDTLMLLANGRDERGVYSRDLLLQITLG